MLENPNDSVKLMEEEKGYSKHQGLPNPISVENTKSAPLAPKGYSKH